MTIVSDTNILCLLAAANAFGELQRLFVRSTLSIPPAVRGKLQITVEQGRAYLDIPVTAIAVSEIAVLVLTDEERTLASTLPRRLNLVPPNS